MKHRSPEFAFVALGSTLMGAALAGGLTGSFVCSAIGGAVGAVLACWHWW